MTRRPLRAVLALSALAAALLAAPAMAAGPVNLGFESGLTGWTATAVSTAPGYYGYDPDPAATPMPRGCRIPDGICAVGTDTFTASTPPSHVYKVTPIGGAKMARLAGPFTSPLQAQPLERYRLEQSFVVDPSRPVLNLAYNVFAYDITGFDDLRIQVRVTDSAGKLISESVQGGHGTGVLLKTTGWQAAAVDLSGWGGR